MTEPARRSAAAFCAERQQQAHTHPCWLCDLPEREEVEAAYQAGARKADLLAWLQEECGYGDTATHNKVGKHLSYHYKPPT